MFEKKKLVLILILLRTLFSTTPTSTISSKLSFSIFKKPDNACNNWDAKITAASSKVVHSDRDRETNVKSKHKLIRAVGPVLASAFCAAAIMYPFDLVRALQMGNAGSSVKKTTIQLLSEFRNTHGIQGFFTQGLAPELARSTWMRFVKFGLFPVVHKAISGGVDEANGTPFTKAMAGIISSIPEAISIMPLEIAKIALQLDSTNQFKNNMLLAMGHVYKERGIMGFTVGYVGLQYRQSAWTAAYFASVKIFAHQVNRGIKCLGGKDLDIKSNKGAQVFSQLLSGFLAGVFGSAFNTPGDTIRTIVQKRLLTPEVSAKLASNFLTVGKEIIETRGIGGLYAGFKVKALHLGGGGALMAFLLPFFNKVFAKLE